VKGVFKMKLTASDVIKSGEQDLFDGITGDLDWGTIEQIFRENHNLGIGEDVEYKKGDIIAHDNQVAYRLEFEVKVNFSVLLDREGNYISMAISEGSENTQENDETGMPVESEEQIGESEKEEGGDISKEISTEEAPQKEIEKEAELPAGDDLKPALSDNLEDIEIPSPTPDTEDTKEKISQTASQLGEMIAEIDDKPTPKL